MLRLRKESPCVSIVGADLSDTPLLSFPEENTVMLIQGVCVNFDCEHLAAGLCLGAHCPRITAKQTPRPPLGKPISNKETNKKGAGNEDDQPKGWEATTSTPTWDQRNCTATTTI